MPSLFPKDDLTLAPLQRTKTGRTRSLNVVLLSLVACLLVFTGLGYQYSSSYRSNDHHHPLRTTHSSSRTTSSNGHDQLSQCPDPTPLAPTKAIKPNPWLPLTPDETFSVQAWLESGAYLSSSINVENENTHIPQNLNLTPSSRAALSDNTVYNIELFAPPKDVTTAYLDSDDLTPSPAPARYARVTIHHGGENEPYVRDWVVGPLPISSSDGEAKSTSKASTTIRPLTEIYHRDPIPFNARGLGDLAEAFSFMDGLVDPLKPALKDLYRARFRNATDPSDEEEDTLVAGPSGPWSHTGTFRRLWVSYRYNTAGAFLHPVGFYTYVDISGNDQSRWKILRIVYQDQIFPSVNSFLAAWKNGTLARRRGPENVKGSLEWTSRKRTNVDSPRDLDHLPGPRSVSFAGSRIRLTRSQNHISWMGWSLYLSFDRDMGLSLWDVKFRGERILYQLAPQEAIAQYAGIDPIQSATAWLDRFFGMGTLVRNLMPGYDCPAEAVYLSADTFHATLRRSSGSSPGGGHVRRDKAICIFEHDTGRPISRHVGSVKGETGATKGYVVVVRSISVVGNYDYIFDYTFHLDGTIEVKVSASGYLQGAYWSAEQDPYGTRLREFSMGSLHDHVINFKVDLDVAGTKNSVLKTTTSQEEITLPWGAPPSEFPIEDEPEDMEDDWGTTVIQQRVTRTYLKTEDEGRVDHEKNLQGGYAVVNRDEPNRWGNPRGYGVHPGVSSVRNTVVGSKRLLKNANWAKHNMAFSRRKETEPSSSAMWNLHLSGAPAVNFDNFFDGESLDQEDVVVWVNIGMHHLPVSEDAPNTKTNVATSSFVLTPLNYFDSDPTLEIINAITINPNPNYKPQAQVKLDKRSLISGSLNASTRVSVNPKPDQPFIYEDYGVKQHFNCIPRDVEPFEYVGERAVFASGLVSRTKAEVERGDEGEYDEQIHNILYPLKIRTGV